MVEALQILCAQHLGCYGLGQIVIATGVYACADVIVAGQSRQENYRRPGLLAFHFAYCTRGLYPSHAGHLHIHQHEFRRLSQKYINRFSAVRRRNTFVPEMFHLLAHNQEFGGVIVYS